MSNYSVGFTAKLPQTLYVPDKLVLAYCVASGSLIYFTSSDIVMTQLHIRILFSIVDPPVSIAIKARVFE